MTCYISPRVASVKPSASMAVSQAAKALMATGADVIDLGLGEPDFATPAHVVEAAHQAALAGDTNYAPSAGTPTLRRAIAAKFLRENDIVVDPDAVIVATGAKQIIFNALMTTMQEGDEVIVPAPYFVSYPEMPRLFGGLPITVETRAERGFRLDPDDLDAALTPRTRWLFLNNPVNPSGAFYTRADLMALGAVLERHPHVLILSDEIYEHILFDGRRFVSFAAACPELRNRSLIVNGVSKAYAMTGWRVGYATGPAPLLKAMTTIQSQSCTSIASICQAAATAALDGPQDAVADFRTAFERRRDLVVEGIATIDGLELAAPDGAFYAYINCGDLIGASTPDGLILTDDTKVATYFLHEAGVAAVPGAAFGLSPYIRISTATSDALLAEAIARLRRGTAALRR